MKFTKQQKIWTGIIIIFVIALIWFIWKFFKKVPNAGGKGETCPDGVTPIPSNGQCPPAKPVAVKSASGATTYVVPAPKPDANGCIQPSSYGGVSFPMGLGMSGPQVSQWQTYLNTTKSAGLAVDGYFGCNTQGATNAALSSMTVDQTTFNNSTSATSATVGIQGGSGQTTSAPTGYVQVPPIDPTTGCDANDNDINGFPCASV